MKRPLNNEKSRLIRGKIAKSLTTFRKNKANLKNIKIGVSPFKTGKYEILSAWRGKNQTQFKANSNPIPKRPKMNIRSAITMNYKNFPPLPGKKQTQNKPKQSQYKDQTEPIIVVIKDLRCYNSPNYN